MEAGGDAPPEAKPPGVHTLRGVEQETTDNPPATEMMESGLPDTTEATKPLHSAEEAVEIPGARGLSPGSSKAPSVLLEGPHENGQKAAALGGYPFEAAESFSWHQLHWGEQMTGVPDPHSYSWSRSETYKTQHYGKGRSWNAGSDLFSDTSGSACASLELRTDAPVADIVNGATELSHKGNRKSGSITDEVDASHSGKAYDIQSSLRDGGNQESVGASKLEPAEETDSTLLAMFSAVANSRLAVQSQQKDEPDFTPAQKLAILRDLYHTKPLVFLERFRTALREEHLACFHHLSGNYEADFYCAEVRRAGVSKTRHTWVRNKRYAALQQLIRDGEYFSDEQMRSRDPLLYEQYIGQYLSEEELQALGSCKEEASLSLSGVLLDSYQEQVIQRRLQVQREQEEAAEEEEEDDEDEDDEEHSSHENDEDKASNCEMDEWVPDPEEKAFLREEFTSRMYQRFLEGKDRDFDYSEVDENPDFDNLDIVSRDEEERYFDGEEAEEADAMEAE
nr:coiled-coil domain-containing protein 97 isoform X1 [Pogona vitticeps]